MATALPALSSSSSSASSFARRDSFSSDEDGLREVQPEELQDLEEDGLPQLDAIDAAPPVLPANQLNPRFNAAWDRDQSGIAKKLGIIWSIGIIVYLLCFALGYLIIIIQPWEACKRHLHMWAVITVLLHVLMAGTKLHLLIVVWRNVQSFDNLEAFVSRRLSILYFINRTLNYVWMSWWLTGTILRFGKSECDASSLMSLMLVQFIIQWCIAGLVLLAACCSCGIVAFLYVFAPHALMGGERVMGATHAQISKLKEEKYDPTDTTVKEEDTTCAICLSTYEKGEKIRHLPCKHHFHSGCIDQWLLKNKSCPFCKQNIDQAANPSAPPPDLETELGLVDLDPNDEEAQPLNIFPQAASSSASSSASS